MITVYFNYKIFKLADKLINLAKNNLIHGDGFPKYYFNMELGIITLLKSKFLAPGFFNGFHLFFFSELYLYC